MLRQEGDQQREVQQTLSVHGLVESSHATANVDSWSWVMMMSTGGQSHHAHRPLQFHDHMLVTLQNKGHNTIPASRIKSLPCSSVPGWTLG